MYEYKKRPSRLKNFIIIFLLMVVVSATSIFVYSIYAKIEIIPFDIQQNSTATRLYNEEISDGNKDASSTLEEATKSVVGISKIKNNGASILDFNATTELGLGTGIIISRNGYIVTNWHVAGNKYSSCYITLENGEKYSGNVVWADSDLDLAIVKIGANNLPYLELGDSDILKLGQTVYAIGNPVGMEFQRSVTGGIVSRTK